jgi:hypothetical protein
MIGMGEFGQQINIGISFNHQKWVEHGGLSNTISDLSCKMVI